MTTVPGPRPDLASLAEGVRACRGCDLWERATHGVPGAGPPRAPLMLVGEQPGDQEDLAGAPFVGPAGRELDEILRRAGITRDSVYVTNAVKHFKWVARGRRRIHARPDERELVACRPWLGAEFDLVDPRVIVALGVTAARGVLGRTVRIGQERGRPLEGPGGRLALVTAHPSSILRVPDRAARAAARDAIVADLTAARELLEAA
ncbi:MAG TPA: UdgX family uracil-DNA binding protein [Miltoncostaeaceae bacterium]|nr:UdgX family uracil-DNA binding protein [Miltoncostaeaceae bacterium]